MPKNKGSNKFMLLCSSDDNESDNIDELTVSDVKQEIKQETKQEVKQETETKKTKYIPPTTRTEKIYINKYDILLYDNTITNIGDTMKLQTIWNVWIHENVNEKWDIDSYKFIYEINSIGGLWRFLHSFDNLDKSTRQYYVMRQGILPIWEDNNNRNGGICSIMINNALKYTQTNIGVETFIVLCLLILNETFILHNSNISGLCYSVKNRNVLIKLWVKNYEVNKNFKEIIPLTLLNKIDHIIYSYGKYKTNVSNISIQYKAIEPE